MWINEKSFANLTDSDLTVTNSELKAVILKELQQGLYTDSVVEPVINALKKIENDQPDINQLTSFGGLYYINANEPYRVIDSDDKNATLAQIQIELSHAAYVIREFDIPVNASLYVSMVKRGLVDKDVISTVNHAIELTKNLINYLKKEVE